MSTASALTPTVVPAGLGLATHTADTVSVSEG